MFAPALLLRDSIQTVHFAYTKYLEAKKVNHILDFSILTLFVLYECIHWLLMLVQAHSDGEVCEYIHLNFKNYVNTTTKAYKIILEGRFFILTL